MENPSSCAPLPQYESWFIVYDDIILFHKIIIQSNCTNYEYYTILQVVFRYEKKNNTNLYE